MKRREFLKYMGASSIFMGAAPSVYAGIFTKGCKEEVCREAWNKLRLSKDQAFEYVHPQKSLPNVLIYGDSISIGYTPTVRKDLAGKANVFRIYQNGQSSHQLIPVMDKMEKTMFQPYLKGGWNFKWDVIHFNVGLHDLKYLSDGKLDKENGTQVSSIPVYKETLLNDIQYLMKKFPKAKLVFATSTSVPEGAKGRFAGDSVKYNKAALEVLSNYPDIVINDLYSLTKPNYAQWCINPGNVHYNETGKKAQGKQVANTILKYL
jgi:hypothetical protein